MICKIISYKNPNLKKKSKQTDLNNISKIYRDMKETCIAKKGIGLAASQIGINKRIVLIKCPSKSEVFMINPEIIDQYGEYLSDEGCLSSPGKYGKVKRYQYVEVKWIDITGNIRHGIAEDLEAVIIQHEVDHLEGILCIDKFI